MVVHHYPTLVVEEVCQILSHGLVVVQVHVLVEVEVELELWTVIQRVMHYAGTRLLVELPHGACPVLQMTDYAGARPRGD